MFHYERERVPWGVVWGWLAVVAIGVAMLLAMMFLLPPKQDLLVWVARGYVAFVCIATVFLVRAEMRHNRRLRLIDAGLCPACEYDLRATPGRCPECGYGREGR
jgi:hypothetical protein